MGCGDGGAEPGAPSTGATLVLDFQPNAVHSGLYAAQERGLFYEQGLDLDIVEPTGTADSAKLLEAGRADFAILDINDFGLARRRGLDLVAVASIVQRPLAAVIAADTPGFDSGATWRGATVGVTGVPSDDAVLRTVLAKRRPLARLTSTRRRSASRLRRFWRRAGRRRDGVLERGGRRARQQGILTREFRVDEFGAPRYPELVIAASGDPRSTPATRRQDSILCGLLVGLEQGYELLDEDPSAAVDDLAAQVPEVDAASQSAQLAELVAVDSFQPTGSRPTVALDSRAVRAWLRWAEANGVLPRSEAGSADVLDGFRYDLLPSCAGAGAGPDPDA